MFEPIWTQKQRWVLRLLALVWLGVTILFWVWWFQPSHVGTRWGFVLTTWVMLWALAVPGYCWFFLLRMKRPTIAKLPANWRVAMVVTRAPSEPFALVQRTLTMMLAQAYPHDTWVADEDPTPEMQAWYKKHRVRVSCRKDNPEYHNQSWPRRRKCKEGNLAYFYDHYGYDHYDFVAQMDVDHVPEQGYLERILLPFVDESVGYVSAPSVGDRNESESWAARARSNAEGMFHGPI